MQTSDILDKIIEYSCNLNMRLVCKNWYKRMYNIFFIYNNSNDTKERLKMLSNLFNISNILIKENIEDPDEFINILKLPRLYSLDCCYTENFYFRTENFEPLNVFNEFVKKCNVNKLEYLNKLNFCHTQIIDLPNNEIVPNLFNLNCSNTYVKEIPNYNSLTYLDCSKTKVECIANLPNLIKLDCSNTFLTKMYKLDSLTYLDCSNNKIDEYIDCKEFDSFSYFIYNLFNNVNEKMKTLICSNIGLNIETLNLYNLSNLTYLDCSFNNILKIDLKNTNYLEDNYYLNNNYERIFNLTYLNCSNTKIESIKFIEYFPNITYLDCSFTDILTKTNYEMKVVDTQYCDTNYSDPHYSNTSYSDCFPNVKYKYIFLRSLCISQNKYPDFKYKYYEKQCEKTKALLNFIKNLSNLLYLNCSNLDINEQYEFTAIDSIAIYNSSKFYLPKITKLDISNTKIKMSNFIKNLCDINNIEYLDCSNTEIDLDDIEEYINLKYLDISYTKTQKINLKVFEKLRNLKYINFSNTSALNNTSEETLNLINIEDKIKEINKINKINFVY